ncbi:MAG: dihydroorotase family protein [Candidatus Bathyarchaeia archaeon]
MDLMIVNGKVVTSSGLMETAIAIDNGKVAGLIFDPSLIKADSVLDAKNKVVMPGLIDPHVHFGCYRPFTDDCRTESRSAVAGGVTTVGQFIENVKGSYFDIFERYKEELENNSMVDMFFHACIYNEKHINEISECAAKLGIRTFKFFMAYKGSEWGLYSGGYGVDDGLLYEGMRAVGRIKNAVVMVHCENMEIVDHYKPIVKASGRQDTKAYTESRPSIVEEEAIRRACFFASKANAPIYVVHISSRDGAEAAVREKNAWKTVYAETCVQYLTFTCERDMGALHKSCPPLRFEEDKEGLWSAVKDGTIDTVASDHASVWKKLKKGSIWESPIGSSLTGVILPIMLTEGVHKRGVPLEKVVEVCCESPAKIMGVYPRKGAIMPGSDADLVIVDLDCRVKVEPSVVNSYSDFTYFDDYIAHGWPKTTIKDGVIVCDDGVVYEGKVKGKYIPR